MKGYMCNDCFLSMQNCHDMSICCESEEYYGDRCDSFECAWCKRVNKTKERFECYLIDDEGNTSSVYNHMVQTVIANYCPVCGEILEKEGDKTE